MADFETRRRALLQQNAAAREAADPAARALIDMMKDQLLIVLIDRLGSDIQVQASEIDATGDRLLGMAVDGGTFRFTVLRKN